MLVIGRTDALWELDLEGTPTWHPITPLGDGPPPRAGVSVQLDPWNDRLVFFGGYEDIPGQPCHGNLYNDTWELRLSGHPEWARITTATVPPPRTLQTAVVDRVNRRMIVHGGNPYDNCTPDRPRADTWALSLVGSPEWIQLATSDTPLGVVRPTAIYSPEREAFIRYDGRWDSCFELDLPTLAWSQVVPPAPDRFPPRRPQATLMVSSDPYRMVMFGGVCWHDLWTFGLDEGSGWQQLPTTGVAPSCGWHNLVYDPRRNRLLAFHAILSVLPQYRGFEVAAMSLTPPRVWTNVTPAGTQPPPDRGFSVMYDPARDRVILLGGTFYDSPADNYGYSHDEVWSLSLGDSMQWSRLTPLGSPGARDGHTAIYDPPRDRMLVFGGGVENGYTRQELHDGWALSLRDDSLVWNPLTPEIPDTDAPIVVDPLRDRLLLLAKDMSLWEMMLAHDGGWRMLPVDGSRPPERPGPALALDATADRLLMFGGDPSADLYAVRFLVPPTRQVRVEIRPGDPEKSVNLSSHGEIPVAIFGGESFAPDSIVLASVRLGGAAPSVVGGTIQSVRPRDVDGDGKPDLAFRIRSDALTDVTPRDSVAFLKARTTHGTWIEGKARIRVVKPPGRLDLLTSSHGELAQSGVQVVNPAQGGLIRVRYALWSHAPAALQLVDVRGRVVRETPLEANGTQRGELVWDDHQSLPAGVYFVRLLQEGWSDTARAVLVN
jgi:hypothetical protein